ncbi:MULTISPECIES: hypothetical protein [Priestia]|uniref:hypothetical protein n=1 Tax=Priestia TaxID=2800373 RepID=UPI00031D8086|nr:MULTISPECIES: hypothetical protein [Priestia]MDT3762870.1 hypothetical protein [Priestia filamentosa]WCM13965.1 hypothetical protein PGN40_11400 [Priestia filamentosa]WRU97318.1 hypothetical protein RYX51_09670 [Priestia filamentosa]SMF32139.1 hypothetical protein SAMN06296056_102678 [Priestia filamentosa]
MKKFVIPLLGITSLTITVFLYFNTQGHSSGYVQWGGNNPIDPTYVERLQGNGIP